MAVIGPVNEIGTNTFGFVLARILNEHSSALQQSLVRLTTGLKSITDDPAGISSSIRTEGEISRITGVESVLANITSFNTTQTSFLDDVSTSLSRMSELATSSESSSTSAATRSANQLEFAELQDFISSVGSKSFNGLNLFSVGASSISVLQDPDGSSFSLTGIRFAENLDAVFTSSGIDVSSTTTAATAQAAVSTAIASLTVLQGQATAQAGRISNTEGLLATQKENLQAVVDRVRNVDTTEENETFSNLSLLTQTGTTLIAQYNLLRSNLLTLFS